MMEFHYNPPDVPLNLLYQDRDIIVAEKPAGLLSVPGKLEGREDCLEARLRRAFPGTLLVHRLDCDTSGVMIFARNKAAQGFLSQEFEKRRAKKTYVARVLGRLQPDEGRVDLPIGVDWPNRPRQMVDPVNGRAAVTDWLVINRSDAETRVQLLPLTGRSHQLRVHMLSLGHPVLGDPIYTQDSAAYPRLMLHAETLVLHHPDTKEWVRFEAPCPF